MNFISVKIIKSVYSKLRDYMMLDILLIYNLKDLLCVFLFNSLIIMEITIKRNQCIIN